MSWCTSELQFSGVFKNRPKIELHSISFYFLYVEVCIVIHFMIFVCCVHVIFNSIPRASKQRSQMCNSIKIGTFLTILWCCAHYSMAYPSIVTVTNIQAFDVLSLFLCVLRFVFGGLRLVVNVEISSFSYRFFLFIHFSSLVTCYYEWSSTWHLPQCCLISFSVRFVFVILAQFSYPPEKRVTVTSTKYKSQLKTLPLVPHMHMHGEFLDDDGALQCVFSH